MENTKENLRKKIRFLEAELDNLEDYHYVQETYAYLRSELDYHLMLLKEIEVQERLKLIDSGAETVDDE